MTKVQCFVAIAGNVSSIAAIQVLSVLLDVQKFVISNEDILQITKLPKYTVLILTEKQLRILTELRSHSFSGAVLVLSGHSFGFLKAKYPILKWGYESHDACEPWKLADLIAKASALVPLEPENLEMLQNQLSINQQWIQQEIFSRLQRLQQDSDFEKELMKLSEIIEYLRTQTSAACHVIIEIDGNRQQIQQHWHRLIQKLRQPEVDLPKTIGQLQKIFEQWCELITGSSTEFISLN